jgi:hypothetical protein
MQDMQGRLPKWAQNRSEKALKQHGPGPDQLQQFEVRIRYATHAISHYVGRNRNSVMACEPLHSDAIQHQVDPEWRRRNLRCVMDCESVWPCRSTPPHSRRKMTDKSVIGTELQPSH